MTTGSIAIHRELYTKPIWLNSTPEHKVVLVVLLLMANHKPRSWEWKGESFTVKRGQFITSLDSILANCGKGISIQNIRSGLKRFQKLHFLTNESTKTGRLVTIVNYSTYQPKEKKPTKQPTDNQQRGNKEVTPNNNDNNDNNVIKDNKYKNTTVAEVDKYFNLEFEKLLKNYPKVYNYGITEDEFNSMVADYHKWGIDNNWCTNKGKTPIKNINKSISNWIRRKSDEIKLQRNK